MEEALRTIACERAEASVEQDRTRILNSIAGGAADLLAPPPPEHPKYQELNGTLRARFAAAGLRMALEKSKLADFLPALAAGSLKDVVLDLKDFKPFAQARRPDARCDRI